MTARVSSAFFCGVFLAVSPLFARREKVDEIAVPSDAKPGKVSLLTGGKGMRYFLRVPRKYDRAKGARLIVFLHGSNMNGLAYLKTIESENWCRDDIIVCPNGEKGDDPFGSNNFTFQSAPFIAGITTAVQDAFEITRSYLGGHSQGGFVTYSVIMHHPELFDGAFPIAAGCWSQNEPNLWETKPEMLAEQKQTAIAVIHGRADPVVPFSQGEHAHGIFLAMGYPRLRFFAPEKLGHQFALSPVPEALEWLDAMTGLEPTRSLKLAEKWSREGEWGWVHQAARAVGEKDLKNARRAENATAAAGREATRAAESVKDAIASEPPRKWLPDWFEFRRQFGATRAAAPLVASYQKNRAQEREKGAQLFRKAVAARRNKDHQASRDALEEILQDTPHTYHAWYALRWLSLE